MASPTPKRRNRRKCAGGSTKKKKKDQVSSSPVPPPLSDEENSDRLIVTESDEYEEDDESVGLVIVTTPCVSTASSPRYTTVLIIDPSTKSYCITTTTESIHKAFTYFELEKRSSVLQQHQRAIACSSSSTRQQQPMETVLEIDTKVVMSNTTLTENAVAWLRLAIESQHIESGTTSVANCGCCVSLDASVLPVKRRLLCITRCTVASIDGYKHASDILRALVMSSQLGAVKDILDLLAAAFAWHFARSNTVHCTLEVDKYLQESHPKAGLTLSDLVEYSNFSSVTHSDMLSFLALKSINATHHLNESHIALDRHVCIWPVCDATDGLPETAQCIFTSAIGILRNRAKRIGHAFTTCNHRQLPRVTSDDIPFDFSGVAICGDAVMREIGDSLYGTHKYHLSCASLAIAKRLFDSGLNSSCSNSHPVLSAAEIPQPSKQASVPSPSPPPVRASIVMVSGDEIDKRVSTLHTADVQSFLSGLKTEVAACHYSLTINNNNISIYAPMYSVPSSVFMALSAAQPNRRVTKSATRLAKQIVFSDAMQTISAVEQEYQDASLRTNSELDYLYFTPSTINRFAYTPKDDKIYATLQSLVGVFLTDRVLRFSTPLDGVKVHQQDDLLLDFDYTSGEALALEVSTAFLKGVETSCCTRPMKSVVVTKQKKPVASTPPSPVLREETTFT